MTYNIEKLRNDVLKAVSHVIQEQRDKLVTTKVTEDMQRTKKSPDDQTHAIDRETLEIYQESLTTNLSGTPALVISEENPHGSSLTARASLEDLLFVIDPVDNTEGAVHGSPAYTSIFAYSRTDNRILCAAVGDFLRREIYYADEGLEQALRFPHPEQLDIASGIPLIPSKLESLDRAYLASYTLKPHRLANLSKAKQLLEKLGTNGRIDCIGGAASLCKVACGCIDGAVEFIKGFQVYDLYPGAYILTKAKGLCLKPASADEICLTLNIGTQDDIPGEVKKRQIFVAAGTHKLFHQIAAALLQDQIGIGDRPLL